MVSKNRAFALLIAFISTASPAIYSMMQSLAPELSQERSQEHDRKHALQELNAHLKIQHRSWHQEAYAAILPSHCDIVPTQTIDDVRSLAGIPYAPRNDKELKDEENSFVLFASGKPIGCIAYTLDQIKGVARIELLGIAPAHRNNKKHKYGSMLMHYTMQQLKSQGYGTVTLCSTPTAIGFYNKLGFTYKTYIDRKTGICNTHTYSFKDRFTGFGNESDPNFFLSLPS